jgi:hypothetical protein
MTEVKWDSIIPDIVESMLPRFSDPKLCLSFIVDNRYNDYSNEECCDDGEAELITIIFNRPSNYTKVFVRVTDFRPNEPDKFDPFHFVGGYQKDPMKFFMTSDHDSCWRSDGLRIFFERLMFNREKMKHRGCLKTEIYSSLSMFGGGPRYILMDEIKVDREERTAMLKMNKKLTIKEAVEYLPDEK